MPSGELVDHDDLEVVGEHVEFAPDAGDRVGDAHLFAIGRNDHAHRASPVRHRAAHRAGLLTAHHPEQHEAVRQPRITAEIATGDALRREGRQRGQAEKDGEIDDPGDDRNRREDWRLTDPSVELVSPQCVASVQDAADDRRNHEGGSAGGQTTETGRDQADGNANIDDGRADPSEREPTGVRTLCVLASYEPHHHQVLPSGSLIPSTAAEAVNTRDGSTTVERYRASSTSEGPWPNTTESRPAVPGSHTSNDTNGSSVGPDNQVQHQGDANERKTGRKTGRRRTHVLGGLVDKANDRRCRDPGPLHLGEDKTTARQQIKRRRAEVPQPATGHDRDPTHREDARDADNREHEADEFDARASVVELDRRIGRDDDHEVRRHPIRPLGSGRLPVGEVTRANEDRLADLVDLERDREFVGDDVGHGRRRHRLGRQHRRESSGERPHLGDSPRVVLDCLRERRDRLFDHGHRGARPIVGARLGDER